MEALVLKENGVFVFETEQAMPVLGQDEVLVKVLAVGICSSDIPRSFNGLSYFYPVILGHEIIGRIGERDVAVYPLIGCKKCKFCNGKNFNLCGSYSYIGSRRHGGFAEYVAAPKSNIIRLPQGMPPKLSVLIEPAAVLIHALERVAFSKDRKILIIGDGAMALLLVKILKWRGINDVTVLGKYDHKLSLAGDFGARAVSIFDTPPATGLNSSFDVVFELAGSTSAYESAIASLKPKGQLVLISNIKQDLALGKKIFSLILRKELTIVGSWNSLPADWEAAGKFLHKYPEVSKTISHTFSLKQGTEAMNAIYKKTLKNFIKAAFVL
jgi:L-iditol 2-dehydrogenase